MRVLVNSSRSDESYQGMFLKHFREHGYKGKLSYKALDLEQLISAAKKLRMDGIFVTHPGTLKNLVSDPQPSLPDWRGSVLQTSIPIVIGNSLSSIFTPTGEILLDIDLMKIKTAWVGKVWKYNYEICLTDEAIERAEWVLNDDEVNALVIDIETNFHNQITSIAFTGLQSNQTVGKTFVFDLTKSALAWKTCKALCENPVPKIFHNGTFDCFHLLRYHIAVSNYIFDTEFIWKCWYPDLPKALARVASYLLPDFYYWKHEASVSPLEYNAKDTINTARIFLDMIKNAPDWVWINYKQQYPNIGPVLYTAFEGLLIDQERLQEARQKAQIELDQILSRLQILTDTPNFNPSSPKQVSTLLYTVLEAKKPKRAKSDAATGKIELQKVARQEPFLAIICENITKYKELRKSINTYYDAILSEGGRLLYSFAIDGTDTGRMACNASSLRTLKKGKNTYVKSNMQNYGTQLQNIPYYFKKAIKADPGYLLGDIDKARSEAICTAYLSGCQNLIQALENPPITKGIKDFYCYIGFKFFGIEFDKEHPLRQIVKKIIHGTNYMMQENTFIDSVGVEDMMKYKKIIGFRGTLYNFASYLLGLYFKHYPEVEQGWTSTAEEVARTGKIVTPDNWTRLFFGNIVKDHKLKRSAVAHKPQHFSVVGINEAFWRSFYQIQVGSKGEFRLKGQIHDSLFYQAKKEKFKEYEKRLVKLMDIPQETEAGVLRIPLDTESGEYWK